MNKFFEISVIAHFSGFIRHRFFPICSKAPALCGFDAARTLAFIDKNRIYADMGKKKN
ncbi:hypothetical protein [Methylobacter luteus]|uniref:hypothetical protein n=1 Tax=Methylobacter luteus TaxID=415 RepID=UPI000411860F|nr:hypothetical protein [Methylobacter luteus]